MIVPDPKNPGEYKTRTREYIYHVFDDSGPVIEWHWHPLRQPLFAHVHCLFPGATSAWGLTTSKLHIATGRVAFEDVVRFLITELNVVPRQLDWESVLNEAMEAFLEWRTWSGSAPPTEPQEEAAAPSQRPKRTSRRRDR